jgi:hypothetical protein
MNSKKLWTNLVVSCFVDIITSVSPPVNGGGGKISHVIVPYRWSPFGILAGAAASGEDLQFGFHSLVVPFISASIPIVSSLGNRTVTGSDRSRISSASFGIHFFIFESMTYQFLYSLKNLYDYRWQQYVVLIFPASYRRNLHEILVPTLISIHSCHNTHNSTMASAASPSPAGTKMTRKNYTMVQVAS